MLIDCKSCQAAPAACDDCVVTVLLGPISTQGVDEDALDAIDRRAFDALVAGGVVSSFEGAVVTTDVVAADPGTTRRGPWRSSA